MSTMSAREQKTILQIEEFTHEIFNLTPMRFMRSPMGCMQNDKMHMRSTKIYAHTFEEEISNQVIESNEKFVESKNFVNLVYAYSVEYHRILLHGVSMSWPVASSLHITSQFRKYLRRLDQTLKEYACNSVIK
uniref:Uncharacterized protein n=1 Tax=Glossina palpalis gambiensis TaxID=67801 RepID=A0A1B0BDN7_9MUSC